MKDLIESAPITSAPASRFDWGKDMLSNLVELSRKHPVVKAEEDGQLLDTVSLLVCMQRTSFSEHLGMQLCLAIRNSCKLEKYTICILTRVHVFEKCSMVMCTD